MVSDSHKVQGTVFELHLAEVLEIDGLTPGKAVGPYGANIRTSCMMLLTFNIVDNLVAQ
jgi:hypothetical protein